MLVLTRKPNESLVIDGDIIVTVVEIRGNRVKLGITAPRGKPVYREEVMSQSAVWRAEDAAKEGHAGQ